RLHRVRARGLVPRAALQARFPGPERNRPVRDRVDRDVRADGRRRELFLLATTVANLSGLRRSGRVAEGGALLRRYGAEWLHRGFESLLLRSEGWQSGRMRRSRKPFRAV